MKGRKKELEVEEEEQVAWDREKLFEEFRGDRDNSFSS